MIGLALATAGDPDLRRQKELCFPASQPAELRQDSIVIWSDAAIELDKLLSELAAGEEWLRKGFPIPDGAGTQPASRTANSTNPAAASRPVAIALFAHKKDFDAFWHRVGQHYGGSFGQIATQAYSYRVFCATWYGSVDEFDRRRSVLVHELAHVWLYQNAHLANDGHWLTEGIASLVQMRLYPQSADPRLWAQRVRDGQYLPLKRLMDQERIAPEQYWQAAMLAETIRRNFPGKLPLVLQAFNAGRPSREIVETVLGSDFVGLEKLWRETVLAAEGEENAEKDKTR
jgi:hypothetical protein